ncbi:MAG: hypothetical protein AB4038_06150 [Prochloraceae cyanobacterium]
MKTEEFLAQLNTADRGWGLWLDRNNIQEYHVGQYSFENDYLPKSFVHVGSLEQLAHQRQKYILNHNREQKNSEGLGKEWANNLLCQWQVKT